MDDFLQTGDLVHAWNGGSGDIYVTGIDTTFSPGPNLNNGVFNGADTVVRTDPDYDLLLQNATWGNTTQTIDIPDLTPGVEYSIQLWLSDTRASCNCENRQKTYSSLASGAPQVTLDSGNADDTIPSQFVIGTFTAKDTTQELTFVGGAGADHPQYNAIQVRTYAPNVTAPLVIHTITHDGNQTVLEWNAVDGASYIVEYQGTLGDPWQELDDNVVAAGETGTFTDLIGSRLNPNPVPNKGFYRVTRAP